MDRLPKSARNEEEVFHGAVELPASERSRYLDRVCGNDKSLRRRVERLLYEYDHPDRLFEQPADLRARPDIRDDGKHDLLDLTGSEIGVYRLERRIGEGGFGTVYLARQSLPLERTVAVKVIKPGMNTRQIVARFQAERQAMAMMDHASIARVFDAGTTQAGLPYFVLEFVDGPSITRYCNDRRMTIPQRLDLVIQVCSAISHAHQKGIIHRDIKPSNILVGSANGDPVPKVIDFGVAKAIEFQLTPDSFATGWGQLVGTLEYMSPEQANLNRTDADTRTDVFALGTLLYELLAGVPPLQHERLRALPFDDAIQTIRTVDPARPSVRLKQQSAAPVSHDPRRLRGELDWIVMKAIEKDPARRYQSVDAFARDLRRYLAGQAVEAGPPSATYRVRKFLHRYRRPMLLALAALLILCSTTVVSLSQWIRARRIAQSNQELARTTEIQRRELMMMLQQSSLMRQLSSDTFRARRPIQSLLLAIEAVETSRRDGKPLPIAHEMLLNATAATLGKPINGPGDVVNKLERSPDGSLFASASPDGSIRVWYLAGDQPGRLRNELRGHTGEVKKIQFSLDNRKLASASIDGTVRVWDLALGRAPEATHVLVARREIPFVEKNGLAFNSRGTVLVANGPTVPGPENGDAVHTIYLWDLDTDNPERSRRTLAAHRDLVTGAVFGQNDRWLYTISRDKTLRGWDLGTTGALSPRIVEPLGKYLVHIERSSDGRLLATCSPDEIWIWDLADEGSIVQRAHLTDAVAGAANVFSESSRWLSFVRKSTSEVVVRSTLPAGMVSAKRRIDRGSNDGLESRDEEKLEEQGDQDKQEELLLATDSREAAAVQIARRDVERYRTVFRRGHDGEVACLFGPKVQMAVSTSGADKTLRTWDLVEPFRNSPLTLPGHGFSNTLSRTLAVFDPDGRFLALASRSGDTRVWRMTPEGPRLTQELSTDSAATAVAFGSEAMLYVGTEDGRVLAWNLEPDGAKLQRTMIGGQAAVTTIAVSPDGRWLAVSQRTEPLADGTRGVVRVWDLADSTSATPRVQRDVYANVLMFSGNSRWLVSAKRYHNYEANGKDLLWDLRPSDVEHTVTEFPDQSLGDATHDCVLSQNGRWLGIGKEYGKTLLYDLATDDPRATERQISGSRFPMQSVAVSNDATWVFAGRWHKEAAELYQRHTAETSGFAAPLSIWPLAEADVATFSPDGRWLAVGSDRYVHLWDLSQESPRDVSLSSMVLAGHTARLSAICVSADSRWLVTTNEHETRLWPLEIDTLLTLARQLAGRQLEESERARLLLP